MRNSRKGPKLESSHRKRLAKLHPHLRFVINEFLKSHKVKAQVRKLTFCHLDMKVDLGGCRPTPDGGTECGS